MNIKQNEKFRITMKAMVIFAALITFPGCLFSQNRATVADDEFNKYIDLNNKEMRLLDFKDNDESLKMKLIQLEVINRSRKNHRVPAVRLDILASRVANRMSREAAENDYVSHWNLAGEKPYMRYAFAGGCDHIAENAYGEWTTGGYDTSDPQILKMMEAGHLSFMAEKAPNDGHKKNVIDKSHNYVGIGFYSTKKQFRYYEEFIDRYFEFENIPSSLRIKQSGRITIKTDGSNYLYFLIIYREKFPVPVKAAQLKKTGSYQDYSNEEYIKLSGWDLSHYREGSVYNIPLKFAKSGLYYVHIYLDKKEASKPSSFSTKGKSEGCGIVIRVDR